MCLWRLSQPGNLKSDSQIFIQDFLHFVNVLTLRMQLSLRHVVLRLTAASWDCWRSVCLFNVYFIFPFSDSKVVFYPPVWIFGFDTSNRNVEIKTFGFECLAAVCDDKTTWPTASGTKLICLCWAHAESAFVALVMFDSDHHKIMFPVPVKINVN